MLLLLSPLCPAVPLHGHGTADATKVTVKVTSANGRTPTPGSTLRTASMSMRVDARCNACGAGMKVTAVERAGT